MSGVLCGCRSTGRFLSLAQSHRSCIHDISAKEHSSVRIPQVITMYAWQYRFSVSWKFSFQAVILLFALLWLIGGMTLWLGRRSLAGLLSLIYAWLWVKCPLWSTNQANSAFHSFGIGKWVVGHVITWIPGMETIKQQTRAVYGRSS